MFFWGLVDIIPPPFLKGAGGIFRGHGMNRLFSLDAGASVGGRCHGDRGDEDATLLTVDC